MAGATNEVVLSEAASFRLLSHPKRLGILRYLQANGEGTATGCGRAVGLSASACSYHLRLLAEHGYVEETSNSADKRTTVWRLLASSMRFQPEDPEAWAAAFPLQASLLDESYAISHRYLERAVGEVSPSWRRASGHSYWRLRLTSGELTKLRKELDAVLATWQERSEAVTAKRGPARETVFLTVGGVIELAAEDNNHADRHAQA